MTRTDLNLPAMVQLARRPALIEKHFSSFPFLERRYYRIVQVTSELANWHGQRRVALGEGGGRESDLKV